MLSFKFLAQHPAVLFSGALLSLTLGFGLFFDHLADSHEARQRVNEAARRHAPSVRVGYVLPEQPVLPHRKPL